MKLSASDKQTDRKDIFENVPVPRAMLTLAVPTVISQLITLLYNLADTWFIGRTNNPYMVGACSLCFTIFMMDLVMANLFGTGGGTLISRLLGRRDHAEASRVCAFFLWLSAAAALLFSLLCFLFRDPFLTFLGASSNTLPYARQYIFYVIILGSLPCVLSNTMSSILRSIGYARYASFGLAMGCLLNIGLDPLFMFVLLPDGMQVTGAAVATFLSNAAALVYFILVFKKLEGHTVLSADLRAGLPARDSALSIFSVGIPAALSTLLYDLSNIVIYRLAAGHGDIQLAAMGIVLKAERLPSNIGIGISIGMVPLIAYNYAAKNHQRMIEIFRFGRRCGLVIAFVCLIAYSIFAPQIVQAFIEEPETVRYGTAFLRVRCLAPPLMFLCYSSVHFMQALGYGKQSLLMAVVRQLVFNIPMLILLNALMGVMGIAWTQVLADIPTILFSYWLCTRVRKREGF